MRRESSTVVVVAGEFGDGLLAGLTQSPNVSVARVPDDAAGQPSGGAGSGAPPRGARLLPGRGPPAAGCRGPGLVPRPAARGAAAPGCRGRHRGQRGPGGPVARHAPVAGARAVVAAAGRASRRGPPLLCWWPRRDPVVARVVGSAASPRRSGRWCSRAGGLAGTQRALA